jgi:hypothetical protein
MVTRRQVARCHGPVDSMIGGVDGFAVEFHANGHDVVVRVTGEVDAATAPTMSAQLDRARDGFSGDVRVDLAAVTFSTLRRWCAAARSRWARRAGPTRGRGQDGAHGAASIRADRACSTPSNPDYDAERDRRSHRGVIREVPPYLWQVVCCPFPPVGRRSDDTKSPPAVRARPAAHL